MRRPVRVNPAPRFTMLAAVCVIVAALYFAQDVLIPLALALLLSFLLAPVVNRFERLRIGRPVAVLVVVLLAFGVIGILGYVVTDQVMTLAGNIDQYKENIISKVQRMRPHSGVLDKVTETVQEVQRKVDQPATQA